MNIVVLNSSGNGENIFMKSREPKSYIIVLYAIFLMMMKFENNKKPEF